jgi:hypothetical protein
MRPESRSLGFNPRPQPTRRAVSEERMMKQQMNTDEHGWREAASIARQAMRQGAGRLPKSPYYLCSSVFICGCIFSFYWGGARA